MLDRFSVLELVPDIPAVQCILIRMLVIEIRRDAHEAVAREALGKIAGVLHKAITLMHEHDGRDLAVAGGIARNVGSPPAPRMVLVTISGMEVAQSL